MARTQILFSNFGSSVLAADIDEGDTNIPLRPGDGVRFPQPVLDFSWFPVAIESATGNTEICSCIDRLGDVLVVQRAAENTAATPFPAGTRVECRVTAALMANFMQRSDPDTDQQVLAAGFCGYTFRSSYNDPATQISFGNDPGIYPFIGPDPNEGSIQVQSDMPPGVILMWSGAVNAIPALWKLCDGSNGTPDLTDKFVRGAGKNFGVGASKLDWGSYTEGIPGHNHTGNTSGHQLTESEMPAHAHRLRGHQPGDNTGGAFVEAGPNVSAVDIEVANNMYTAGGGASHSHGLSYDGRNDAGYRIPDVSPAYYALAFIMKVA